MLTAYLQRGVVDRSHSENFLQLFYTWIYRYYAYIYYIYID